MENNTQMSSSVIVDVTDSINSEDAAGLFILPNMTVGVDIPSKYTTNGEATILPPHVQRIFELSLCVTSTNSEDQTRFWGLVESIAKKRMNDHTASLNLS